MITKYFRTEAGEFIGGFSGVLPPDGAIEVPTAPEDARQVWSGGIWGGVPIPTPTLTKRQIIAAMILGASILYPDADVTTAIGTIADPTIRALALNDWRNAPYYLRSNALFNDATILAAMGMTSAQVDGLWALAATLPA